MAATPASAQLPFKCCPDLHAISINVALARFSWGLVFPPPRLPAALAFLPGGGSRSAKTRWLLLKGSGKKRIHRAYPSAVSTPPAVVTLRTCAPLRGVVRVALGVAADTTSAAARARRVGGVLGPKGIVVGFALDCFLGCRNRKAGRTLQVPLPTSGCCPPVLCYRSEGGSGRKRQRWQARNTRR